MAGGADGMGHWLLLGVMASSSLNGVWHSKVTGYPLSPNTGKELKCFFNLLFLKLRLFYPTRGLHKYMQISYNRAAMKNNRKKK